MGKKLTQEEAKTMVADAIKNNMTSKAISEKYGIGENIACYIAKYSKLGYELADKKKRTCPRCGTQLDKKMHFCWKCGMKAIESKDEILEQAEKLLKILATFPSSSSDVGISIVHGIKDYIKREAE